MAPQSLHDSRLGQTLDALYKANLHTVFSAIALRALDIYRVNTPWLHQDTTTISFYGAYDDGEGEPKGPRPTYGYSKEGRGDLKQVLLSLGVSGDRGLPLRMGLHDGNRSDTVDVPQAIEQSAALGLDGLRGIVADSKAYTPRTLGLCRETGMGLVTLVPRTCAIRQEVEAWGQRRVSLPLLLEKPGKRRADAPRRWYGSSVTRQVEVEDGEGHVTLAPVRFVAVYSTQLAQRHAEAMRASKSKRPSPAAPGASAPDRSRRLGHAAPCRAKILERVNSQEVVSRPSTCLLPPFHP